MRRNWVAIRERGPRSPKPATRRRTGLAALGSEQTRRLEKGKCRRGVGRGLLETRRLDGKRNPGALTGRPVNAKKSPSLKAQKMSTNVHNEKLNIAMKILRKNGIRKRKLVSELMKTLTNAG